MSSKYAGATVILVAAVYEGDSENFGAVIFIGPLPIVVDAGSEAALMVLFGIILAVLSVIMFLVMSRRIKGSGG